MKRVAISALPLLIVIGSGVLAAVVAVGVVGFFFGTHSFGAALLMLGIGAAVFLGCIHAADRRWP